MCIKPFNEVERVLNNSASAWIKLVGYIRTNYIMDERWNDKDELKFKRSGKTLATFYVRDGYFLLLLIFGKQERAVFEEMKSQFPEYILNYYDSSKTFHDGKWMFIEVHNEEVVDPLIKMLNIKKKPNRKKEDLLRASLGKCGNRCDLCLLYEKNNIYEKGNLIFQKGDCRCYHSAKPEDEGDYSDFICKGCHDDCEVVKCVILSDYQSCIECDYNNCKIDLNNFTNPGRCNLGISADDIEKYILPYCGKERFEKMKNTLTI